MKKITAEEKVRFAIARARDEEDLRFRLQELGATDFSKLTIHTTESEGAIIGGERMIDGRLVTFTGKIASSFKTVGDAGATYGEPIGFENVQI